jgi:predicted flap endonuclease-1-like 5' DNA nuclease
MDAQWQQKLDAREARIAELEATVADLRAQLARQEDRLADLPRAAETELALRQSLAERDAHIAQRQASIDELRRTLDERDAHIADLEWNAHADAGSSAEVAELRAQLPPLNARITELLAAESHLRHELRARDARVAELERVLATATDDLVTAKAQSSLGPQDDLKVLRGVGPSFERSLHGLGIRSFEQIAGWTEQDIVEIAGKLKTTPLRIQRDDWVGGARDEVRRKQSGASLPG